ncbi:MAG: methionyl-tRNA formyltransferase [Bacteroidales bacterium]|nr:methionyl-tRNA formyltransferase [Bacteroidales bacterium]
MMSKRLKIVFMGTPEFAVASLNQIHKSRHQVVAVVTVPDKPAGRGQKIHESAVKIYAQENNLPVLQPEKLKNPEFVQQLKSLEADVFVVVAFRMLPREIWSLPRFGTFNLHASLLPQYRGAAPINWAIINGEKETGATTFFIDDKIDTGKIILQEKIPIGENETAGELHDRLMIKGADLVVETLYKIASGEIETTSQDEFQVAELAMAPKIFRQDLKIDWTKTAKIIHNHIRGLSPYPGAFTEILDGENNHYSLKIFKASIADDTEITNLNVGQIRVIGQNKLLVGTADRPISLEIVQLEGKKRLPITDFLLGFRKIEQSKMI